MEIPEMLEILGQLDQLDNKEILGQQVIMEILDWKEILEIMG
jgi:glutaredoxin 2